jgi:hypothetical protein
LQKIKEKLPPNTRISATIRLHQYKFPGETGVPPVHRGMLMLYNTGDLDNPDAPNSIFTPEAARAYLDGAPKPYPQPLDVALPVYTWALAYRDGAFWKILNNPDTRELADTARFEALPALQPHTERFRVKRGTFLAEQYLRPGDLLRLETVNATLLSEALKLLPDIGLAPDATLAFFHLDSSAVERFPTAILQNLCDSLAYPLQAR